MACTNIYPELLEWSSTRPMWQQDAIRRLILNPNITVRDIQEIEYLCRTSYGIGDQVFVGLKPQPLEQEHIPCQLPEEVPVRILSISEVKNVNAICSDTPLTFADTGLTVIYGENGSGKSGYARILKTVCRSKERPEILPNAFSHANSPPSAKINYKVGNTEITLGWTGRW